VNERDAQPLRMRIKNSLGELSGLTEAVHAYTQEHGIPGETVFIIDFCFEEIFTNLVKYGYRDETEHWIDASVLLSDETVFLVLEDDGEPFDPNAAPEPDLSSPLEERPIGGLGLHLVRAMASNLEYVSEPRRNRLTIEINRYAKTGLA
jgi:serine/threonine-protein kinase RsbW